MLRRPKGQLRPGPAKWARMIGRISRNINISSWRLCCYYVVDFVSEPTRITELSVPKSSEALTAKGSMTQRLPSTMKAYSCRPDESGTDTAHTPGAPEGLSSVTPLVHSLKSPTSWTFAALESTKTNRDRKSVVLGKECRSRWSPYH